MANEPANELKDLLSIYRSLFSLKHLEQAASIPPDTLRHWLSGNRGLPAEAEMKVLATLRGLAKAIENTKPRA